MRKQGGNLYFGDRHPAKLFLKHTALGRRHPKRAWSLISAFGMGSELILGRRLELWYRWSPPQTSTPQEIPSTQECYCDGWSITTCSRTGFRALCSDPDIPIPKADCQLNNGVEPLKTTAGSSGAAAAGRHTRKQHFVPNSVQAWQWNSRRPCTPERLEALDSPSLTPSRTWPWRQLSAQLLGPTRTQSHLQTSLGCRQGSVLPSWWRQTRRRKGGGSKIASEGEPWTSAPGAAWGWGQNICKRCPSPALPSGRDEAIGAVLPPPASCQPKIACAESWPGIQDHLLDWVLHFVLLRIAGLGRIYIWILERHKQP